MRNGLNLTDEREIVQWLLDSEPVGMSLGWPIGLDQLVDAIRQIVTLSNEKGVEPSAIASAWNSFTAAVGPTLTEAIVESDDWHCLSAPPETSVPLGTVVWERGDRCVVGRRVLRGGHFVNFEFVVI